MPPGSRKLWNSFMPPSNHLLHPQQPNISICILTMKTYLFSPNPTVFRWQKIHFPLTLSVTPLQTGSVTVPLPLPPVSSQTSLTRPLPPPAAIPFVSKSSHQEKKSYPSPIPTLQVGHAVNHLDSDSSHVQ